MFDMNVLIIEDERPAQQLLIRLLGKYYPDFTIVSILDSITSAVEWLRSNSADLIFMDVELSDGTCFEIFRHIDIKAPVIITTAYEQYALEAFKTKCIDYMLKPIEDLAFKESVERCLQFCAASSSSKKEESTSSSKAYRQRYTIKVGSRIVVVDTSSIAYFFSEDKSTYIITDDDKQYLYDQSLDSLKDELDPEVFYKLSRGCIASLGSISNISKYFNSRLKVTLKPGKNLQVLVSRDRVQGFLEWLEGKK